MISKIKLRTKISVVSTEGSRMHSYVHKDYKEILDKYKNTYGLRCPGIFGYPSKLYDELEHAYLEGSPVTLVRVTASKVNGMFKYLPVPGLRTYDIPLECFSTTNTNEAFSELLRSFNDK